MCLHYVCVCLLTWVPVRASQRLGPVSDDEAFSDLTCQLSSCLSAVGVSDNTAHWKLLQKHSSTFSVSQTVWQLKQIYIWKYTLICICNLVFKIFLRKIGGRCCCKTAKLPKKNNRNHNSEASSQCYFLQNYCCAIQQTRFYHVHDDSFCWWAIKCSF